jgi:hypothetical protein
MPIKDIVGGKLPKGSQVELEGTITELLPIFLMGGSSYERFSLEDGTARITVIMPSSDIYLLPGDRVRVVGRVRPCPYAPAVDCIETESEYVEIKEWKWIEPSRRRSENRKGPFNMSVLLHMTRLDEEVIRGIVETDLDPVRIRERFESCINSGESCDHLLDMLSAMTMYSIFLRDLDAASSVRMTLKLLETLPIGKILNLLSDMVETLVSREGLAPYLSGEGKGIVERYPVADESSLKEVIELRGLADRLINDLREGKKEFIILEFSRGEELEKIRKVVEIVAGITGSRLLLLYASSVAEDTHNILSEIKETSKNLKEDERAILYLEAPELLFPNEKMLGLLKLPAEALEGVSDLKSEFSKVFRELSSKILIVAATVSSSMVDGNSIGRPVVIPLETGVEIASDMEYSI